MVAASLMAENSIDRLADELAHWAIDFSDKIAASIQGGVHAPNSAHLTEPQKLDYYTRQFFDEMGQPNIPGRAQEMQRLGPEGFAETFAAVLKAHPDLRQPPPGPYTPGFRGPDGLPGTDIAPDGLPAQGATVAPLPDRIPMPSGPIAPDGLPTTA